MLKRAENASLSPRTQIKGIFRAKEVFHCIFNVGKHYYRLDWTKDLYDKVLVVQRSYPVMIRVANSDRTYWYFRDRFFWDNDGLSDEQVHVLLLDRERQLARRIERAAIRSAQEADLRTSGERAPIPDEVKTFVWQRDKGQCVKCGSNQRLEFDHIIPVIMGGSNTARNIQLLCEVHNREKGGHLA